MDLSDLRASASIVIATPSEKLYEFIADMPRIAEISPQCTGGEWESDARAEGALFVGSNTSGDYSWQARMRVTVADPPRQFAWENIGAVDSGDGEPNARWSYTFTPVPGGTKVEEAWKILRITPEFQAMGEDVVNGFAASTQTNIEETLAKLKALHEG